jgi:predicted RNA methylase|tara:strand:- start:196 stop:399 length:204 start_codon:yes stop_codon:yes gene_type:complete
VNVKDYIAVIGSLVALGIAWGMTNQKVYAMEKDMDRMEQALMMFTQIEVRIAVMETELKNINKKLDR